MEQIDFSLPTMYGDHHVVTVRKLVSALAGVTEVRASAAQKKITVRFDATQLTADKIAQALTADGYPPGQLPSLVAAAPDVLQHAVAAEQIAVRESKYAPPPAFGVCPGLEVRYVGSEHPADRK